MRLLLAAATTICLACPVVAQDAPSTPAAPDALPNYAEEQMCYTWLSAAANFGEPESTRADWGKLTLRIRDHLATRTDGEEAQRKADEKVAVDEASKFIMAMTTANEAEKPKLVADVTAKAEACKAMVPPEE